MQIALLTHAEAADSAVFANLARHFLNGGSPTQIAHADRPDVGKDAPLPTRAALTFGAAPAPSTAAVEAPAIVAPTSMPVPVVPPVPAPLPVPAVPVPVVPAAPSSPAAAGTPPVDTAGLPWDVRIHASSKALLKDGTWRQKRDTNPAVLAQVEAELRKVMALPTPPVPANSVFAAGAAAAGLPAPVLVEPTSFQELMLWLTPHMPHKITPDLLNATLAANGIPSLAGLIQRSDLVQAIVAQLKPHLA